MKKKKVNVVKNIIKLLEIDKITINQYTFYEL